MKATDQHGQYVWVARWGRPSEPHLYTREFANFFWTPETFESRKEQLMAHFDHTNPEHVALVASTARSTWLMCGPITTRVKEALEDEGITIPDRQAECEIHNIIMTEVAEMRNTA